MFCPQCACDNDAQQNFCRKCGQPLAAVRAAMEGRVDEATKSIEGERRVWPHRIRTGVGIFLIVVAISTVFTAGKFGLSNIQSASVVLILILVWFLQLGRKHHRVARLLSDRSDHALPNSSGNTPSLTGRTSHPSITEQDTLRLKAND